MCDGENDCQEGTDEQNCQKSKSNHNIEIIIPMVLNMLIWDIQIFFENLLHFF